MKWNEVRGNPQLADINCIYTFLYMQWNSVYFLFELIYYSYDVVLGVKTREREKGRMAE